ncbi:hypothetical protein CPC08DRAFT_819633 [Agrocybe pediades]|nr:hypothetical protein CPC08DRAFT_819633 [Agrocybe pediades]
MRSPIFALLALLSAVVVNAHFQLAFPPPRGVFDEDNEPHLCDGYTSVATNRTDFPLSGGFFSLNSEHPQWTAGVTLSTKANPTSFDDFSLVNTFFQVNGEGAFCIPLDLKSSNFTGLQDGQNVTIEIVFSGGDGQLYQCADVTLRNNFNISSSVSCTNATGSSNKPSGAIVRSSSSVPAIAAVMAVVSMALLA